ncbi:response regulator transcription factor [Oscillatoria sp. CS-180]|uniref:response regulator transcription factor n=1 Tax=Oscillatoria sp. CS-180 TaxID=3021720 RepID=UPI00232FE1D7|nr:response regulator transcription factor [Oscillatoria sp. CS-180]MDB9528056.1 response regulator transcription factor [Oscillatoria sp. CS-180]
MTLSTALLRHESAVQDAEVFQQCSILLADNNLDFRQGLRSLLEFYNHHSPARCVIVGEAASRAQALHLASKQRPRLVILNIEIEDTWESIGELLKELQQLDKAPSVLLVSEQRDPDYLFEGMQAGAAGYIAKDRIATELLVAISTIQAGQIYLSQSMVNTFFYLFQANAKQAIEKCKLLKLSKREREVLKLLARGESNEAIANELFISIATVKSHFTSIFEKLGVKSRTQAIIRALRLGLV